MIFELQTDVLLEFKSSRRKYDEPADDEGMLTPPALKVKAVPGPVGGIKEMKGGEVELGIP
jgi:hypothetical protein